MINIENLISEVQTVHREGRLIPFIGSGFSKPLGLPDWRGMVAEIGLRVGFEEELFFLHGSYPQLLEYLKTYHHSEWKDFIQAMRVKFDSEPVHAKRKSSKTHQALAELDLQRIYTTNYDSHIENALSDRGKNVIALASLEDFVKKVNDNINCEIIKFHGTLVDEDSMILTETQYFERMALDEAVDQKLRADILSNNFLFMGYSFSDANIRYIWYKIHKLKSLQKTYSKDLALRKSYYVTFGNEPVQSQLLKKWDIKTINLDPVDPNSSLADFLQKIK
jgi:hypothetical protein